MIKQRKIELLAPAKNLECGIAAIDHGADAVYIGAPKFGARAAAVNSLEDIAVLVEYAHLYNARIYVTVNTILKDEELQETEKMIWALFRAGVDALIVQDMGITGLICSHDLLANAAMVQCQQRGLRVPADISIIGFDDLPMSAYTSPPMTTIRQDRTQLGKSAFYALSSLLADVPISTLLLHARLMVRHSSGKAPQ